VAEPLVAVTSTVYVPGVEDETDKTDDAIPPATSATLVGFSEAVRLAGAEAERATVPLNRLMLVSVIIEVAEDPEAKVRLAGLGEMRKSLAAFVMLQLSVYVPTTGTNCA